MILSPEADSAAINNAIPALISGDVIVVGFKEDLKLCTGKRLILAGVLKNQNQKIIDAYSDWIELKIYEEKGEWVLLEGIL